MPAVQRISRVRREYNQFVADETLEDYSLRFTAKSARKWSCLRVANTALGSISFLALEAIGAAITLSYGFSNAVLAILVVGSIIFLTGLPISYYAARHGVDMDLLTRGAGFGYIGSTITSLIYASFTFIFFAIEAVILAMALQMCFGIPLWMGYLISALAIIPLVTHGITLISRFQVWTQPVWVLLIGAWWWRERVSARQAAAVGVALLGLILASSVLDGDAAAIDRRHMIGLLLCLAGSVSYAVVTLLAKAAQRAGSYAFTTWQCGVGAVMLAWWPWFNGWPPMGPAWGWLIGLGVLHTGLAYVLLYAGMARLPTARIAVLQFVYPAAAVLVDLLVYGRTLSALQTAGMLLMGLALWSANRPAAKGEAETGKMTARA